ncbi:MFS monocarboxylate transporter [Colletotrichum karsti]|uniref:MFS monocarboxylate transporter n=1 Tax=Colletotrichum karsti TaxID=1095194 RepID=A0A9P6HWK2_9PEZI|nr:MFS monocarboxylate transporter [Colletotrichum karsti]KAF9872798.1 MFS monocarboxylate transporter [Colletotrichum karsti]
MRFAFAFLLFLITLTVALPVANPASKSSSDKQKLEKGIKDNLKAGDKEIAATKKAQDAAKKNDAKGLKKDEKGIKSALNEATKDREKNQKIAGNKDPKLTQGLGKVENAQKGAKKTVNGLTGDPKKDKGSLDKLDKTFKKGKKVNQDNLKEYLQPDHAEMPANPPISEEPPSHASQQAPEIEAKPGNLPDEESSPVEVHTEAFTYPDGGTQAWLQVVACNITNQISWGYPSSYGAYQAYYTTTLGLPSAQVSWVGSVQIFLAFGICAFSGRLVDAGYGRHAVITGSFMAVTGTLMTSFCTKYWQIFLAQGLYTGIGMGIMFMPGIAIVGSYFKERRTLALSIANVGTGLGSVTFPTLLNYTIPHVGFAWAVRCQALMMLVLAIIACTLLKPRLAPRKKGSILEWAAFKERSYSLFAVGSFFFFLALYFSFFYINTFAQKAIGLSYTESVSLLLILNSSGIPSRALAGILAGYLGAIHTSILSNALVGIMYFAWIGVRDKSGLYALTVIFGIANGFAQGIFTPALASLTQDPQKMGVRFGMVATIVGAASFAGPPISGAIVDASGGKYIWAQIWAGAVTFLACLFLIAARIAAVGTTWSAKV